MFKNKDYKEYFNELHNVEVGMKKEATKLLKLIDDPLAQELLRHLVDDETRHIAVVKQMSKLI